MGIPKFKKHLICSLIVSCAALLATAGSFAGDSNSSVADNPILNIEKNQDAAKSLKWLYENDADFHHLMDNMFANIHPLSNGEPNPW